MVRFIQRDRKIFKGHPCLPSRNDLLLVAIDHRDLTSARHIYKYSPSLFLQDESFGMGREVDRTELFPICSIDNGDAAVGESHIDFAFIGSNIVRVVAQTQLADRLEGFCLVDFAETVLIVRDEKTIELRNVTDTLRCAETGNGMNAFALSQIDYFKAVIAERTDKQSFARGIERKMIDPPFHARQRN